MAWAYFVFGLVLLALGGDSIVKGASGLAQRCGISAFGAGLVLVAFGTSLPELAVNAYAFFHAEPALALGNAVGSNIANFGLTLGAAALASPLLVRMRVLSPLLVVLALATLMLIWFGWNGWIGHRAGIILLLVFAAVLAFLFVRGPKEGAEVRAQVERFAFTRTGLALNLLRFAVAAALLYFGAKFVVAGAQRFGVAWHWPPLLVGLLPVAIGTALPEAAAAIAAAKRGQGDLVIGHVIGSSLFNLLVIVGGMALTHAVQLPELFVRYGLPGALAFALLLLPMLRGDMRIRRWEGVLLLAAFIGWVAFAVCVIRGAQAVIPLT